MHNLRVSSFIPGGEKLDQYRSVSAQFIHRRDGLSGNAV